MACCTANACLRQTAAACAAPPRLGDRREAQQAPRAGTKPSQTLSPRPAMPDPIHAVVPIAGAEQRQAVRTNCQARVKRADAVLEQRRRISPMAGRRKCLLDRRRQRTAAQEGHGFVEHRQIARDFKIVGDDEGQPDAVVRHARLDSLTGGGQPPMLHVALRRTAARPRAKCVRGQWPAAKRTAP